MKFICKKTDLVEKLANVQRAVSTKSNLAALEGIFIEATDKKIKLFGYNMELGITTELISTVEEQGKIILNARVLTDIVRRLPDEKITFSVENDLSATIKSGRSKFKLLGIDPEQFPTFPELENPVDIEMSVSVMKSMIKQTLFAVSDSEDKPVHTGTLFEISKNQIVLVSVDGYRLAIRKETINQENELKFVVPGKTLNEVLRLMPEDDDAKLTLRAGMRHIGFKINDYFIISRLLEGDFLDYRASIPTTVTSKVEVKTRDFIDAIERVSLLITDSLRSSVKCIFGVNQIQLSCNTAIGRAEDEISAIVDGEATEIGVNNRYITDALKNADTDEVIVELNGSLNPIKIMPKNSDSFLFLVLPVRLRN